MASSFESAPNRHPPISRRDLFQSVAIGAAAASLTPLITSCATTTRTSFAPHETLVDRLGAPRAEVLRYASLAPSGHNAQPWQVHVDAPNQWVLGFDSDRWLPEVDPQNREALLSLGHFAENLVIAAGSAGFQADVDVVTGSRRDREVARITLTSDTPTDFPLRRLSLRRTLRSGHLSKELTPSDADDLLALLDGAGRYVPRGSKEADWLRDAEVEAMREQAWRDSAQQELARWLHLDRSRAERRRDGLTPETMEASWFARQYMYLFMNQDTVMKESFREESIDAAAEQAGQGAGWIVVASTDRALASIIEAGRRTQRMWLRCRERGIAIHPMSQILEEDPWRQQVAGAVGLDQTPQYVLRIGYVNDYPKPVSMRRPVQDFVTFA
jgi:nitroreductase